MEKNENFRDLIELYFDKAIEKDDKEKLFKQMDSNPLVHQLFEKEKTYRNYIRTHVKRPSVPTGFIDSIKNRIKIV